MRVAVIGGGVSGLITIKTCLDEGVEVVGFEKEKDVGGLWRYTDEEREGGTVYETTVMNSCKELIAFTDFPPPEDFPNFMHHTKIMKYFNMYTEHFKLRKYIRLSTQVLSCEHADDYDKTGRWKIISKVLKTEKVKTEIFDGVLVCIGHHGDPYIPLKDFPGITENFKGHYIHSNSYRKDTAYIGKKVVVIGTGNSGCDIAVELSRKAKQVYLSTRRGCWVFNRMQDNGVPFDIALMSRFVMLMKLKFPAFINYYLEKYLNRRFDHDLYGLKATHHVLDQHPTINDELPNRILNGTVKIKDNVTKFERGTAVFADGTREHVDEVIFGTGYDYCFPFISEDIIKVRKNVSELYMLIWPLNAKHNTLGVIGLHQPFHSINNVSEMQARWSVRVLKGLCKLPSPKQMEAEYNKMRTEMKRQFIASQRHTIEVDGIDYMDKMAVKIGCKPKYFRMMITDPALAKKVYFGPSTGYQYRLYGPGSWSGAREAIMGQDKRIMNATKTRTLGEVKTESGSSFWFWAVAVLALAGIAYYVLL